VPVLVLLELVLVLVLVLLLPRLRCCLGVMCCRLIGWMQKG
jgi:hypothetical protein